MSRGKDVAKEVPQASKKEEEGVPGIEVKQPEGEMGLEEEQELISVSSQELIEVEDNDNEKSSSGAIEFPKARRGRKVRTYLSKEKVVHMTKLFTDYSQQLSKGETRKMTLREIGKELNLGYSTVLHRFREFRGENRFKAQDLSSVVAKKRKYKKSFVIEDLIRKSLTESGKVFYTASELATHIQQAYNMKFSRSILSRHLDDMGFSGKKQKEDIFRQVRSLYAQILMPLISSNKQLIYVDELTCSIARDQDATGQNCVSVMVVLTSYGLLYYKLQQGFFTRQLFFESLKQFVLSLKKEQACRALMGDNNDLHFVMDMNRIHRDGSASEPGFKQLMIEENIAIYYIPPNSADLNPNEEVFDKIKKRQAARKIASFEELWGSLEEVMEGMKGESVSHVFEKVNKTIAYHLKE